MTISIIYRELDNTPLDITDRVVLRSGDNPANMTSMAEERAVGTWDLIVDDPDGTLSLNAFRLIYVLDSEAPGQVWVGLTSDMQSERDTLRTGTERRVRVSMLDLNTILEQRVLKSTDDANRPAETDVERMQWIDSLTYVAGPSAWISTDNPVDMDAQDFTGRMVSEVIEDCMGQSGKNAFMFDDPDTGVFSLFYGNSSSEVDVLSSDLRISNVLSDVDNETTWEPSLDTTWDELPSRIYSGLFANYDGGNVYAENASTVSNYAHRDTVLSWPDVKTAGAAAYRANRYLQTIATPEHRITTSIEVPAANVNDAIAGYRIQCRFSHFPPYADDFTWMRILQRSVTWLTDDRYRIQYVLSATPPPSGGDKILIAFISHTEDGMPAPTDDSAHTWTKLFWSGDFADPTQFPGPGHAVGMAIWYRAVVPGESAEVLRITGGGLSGSSAWVFQVSGATLAGLDEIHGSDTQGGLGFALDSPSAAVPSVWFAGFMLQKVNYGQFTKIVPVSGTPVVNDSSINVMGSCGDNDTAPPHTYIGYDIGTGVLTVNAEPDPLCAFWTGAVPNYNYFGRGYGGLLLPLVGTFSIVQQGFASAAGSDCVVTLPSAP